MDILTLCGLVFICFGHIVWAKTEQNEYFLIGKPLELRPPSGVAGPFTSVQWRHNENIASEWSIHDGVVEDYRNFKGRTDINVTNGYLVIRDMTEAEAGRYSVEINNNRLDVQYVVQSLMEVPKPSIWVKPGKNDSERVFDCQGEVEKAGPVTFWWNINGPWFESDRKITIVNNEVTQSSETISCKMVNPVGEKESKPEPNPFYKNAAAGGNPALGALVLIPIIILGLAGVGYWQRDKIMTFFGRGGSASVSATTNATPVDKDKGVEVPLKEENSG